MMKFFVDEENKNLICVFPTREEICFSCYPFDFYYDPNIPNLFIVQKQQDNKKLWTFYHIDFASKTVKEIFATQEKILAYNFNFVFYKTNTGICIARNLDTGKESTIVLNFDVQHGKAGKKYALFYHISKNRQFALYDIEQKQIIQQGSAFVFSVSEDFLDGNIPLYYVKNYSSSQKCYICTIYNRNKPIGEVRTLALNVELFEILKRELYDYNWKITEKTKFVSDVDVKNDCINFYKLTEEGLQFVNALKVNKDYFYLTHLFSCSGKFLIYAKKKPTKSKSSKILIYDVNTQQIEYENEDLTKFLFIIQRELFAKTLSFYVHGLQNYFFDVVKDKKGAFLTFSPKMKFEGIRICKHLERDIYIAYKDDIDKLFLLQVYQNGYKILTNIFYKPEFVVLDNLVFILTRTNGLFIQDLTHNVLKKIVQIKGEFARLEVKKLSDKLIFIKFYDVLHRNFYSVIYDLTKDKIHTQLVNAHFVIEPLLSNLCDYFGIIDQQKDKITFFNKEGEKIVTIPYQTFEAYQNVKALPIKEEGNNDKEFLYGFYRINEKLQRAEKQKKAVNEISFTIKSSEQVENSKLRI